MVTCDCCGTKTDERSLKRFATKFICTGCRSSNSDLELAEGLYNVDAELEFNGVDYCATVSKDGEDFCGNADDEQEAVELAIRNMLER